ncbi:MAG TPA: hypothetical protein VGN20_21420 [Mucilaginibacter sp.]|jgi:hypothetical protein
MANEYDTDAYKLQPFEKAVLIVIILIFLIFPYIMISEHIKDVEANSYYTPYKTQ